MAKDHSPSRKDYPYYSVSSLESSFLIMSPESELLLICFCGFFYPEYFYSISFTPEENYDEIRHKFDILININSAQSLFISAKTNEDKKQAIIYLVTTRVATLLVNI